MSVKAIVNKFNSSFAMYLTIVVGSIWAFYAFILFGLIPLIWPNSEQHILYWSNFLQLVFLPVITVGTNVLNRSNKARSAAEFKAVMQELKIVKEMNLSLQELVKSK